MTGWRLFNEKSDGGNLLETEKGLLPGECSSNLWFLLLPKSNVSILCWYCQCNPYCTQSEKLNWYVISSKESKHITCRNWSQKLQNHKILCFFIYYLFGFNFMVCQPAFICPLIQNYFFMTYLHCHKPFILLKYSIQNYHFSFSVQRVILPTHELPLGQFWSI